MHVHNTDTVVNFGVGSGGLYASPGAYIGTLANYAGTHSHSVSGNTCASGTHSHDIVGGLNITNFSLNLSGKHTHNIEGESGRNGGHHHDLNVESLESGSHSHWIQGQTDWSSDNHTHEVTFGETDSVGKSDKIDILNPYYALAFIIKVSDDIHYLSPQPTVYTWVSSVTMTEDVNKESDESDDALLSNARVFGRSNQNNALSLAAITVSVVSLFVGVILCCLCGYKRCHEKENDGDPEGEMNDESANNVELKQMNMYSFAENDNRCVQQPNTLDDIFDDCIQTDMNVKENENEELSDPIDDDDEVVRSINNLNCTLFDADCLNTKESMEGL